MDIKDKIKEILSQQQFSIKQEDKEKALFSILIEQIKKNVDFSSLLNKFYMSLGKKIENYESIRDIPPIPVSMFKKFELRTCPEEKVSRTLYSSATTTGIPSKIYIDKETTFRQSKALIATLKSFIGTKRRPLLVIDTEDINQNSDSLTARGAAVRGIMNFSKKTVYVLEKKNGELSLNIQKLKEFSEEFSNQEILVSGFTYIIWSEFVNKIKEKKIKLNFPNMKLIHSGGWKKLTSQAVDKEFFSETLADIFGTKTQNIIDFYGMVEQLGVVFLDCEEGYKHIPNFADIIIRNFYTMEENPLNVPGLIEILSIIPSSYPGQAIITEDVGELIGCDNCPCGRKGKYFQFHSRVEKTETRGCGDTFAERKRGN